MEFVYARIQYIEWWENVKHAIPITYRYCLLIKYVLELIHKLIQYTLMYLETIKFKLNL